jgi:hypothetical protein
MDATLRGSWTLNVAKSSFGSDGPPSAGTVRWTEHGWVLALVFGNGYVYADGVITDRGCALMTPASGSPYAETTIWSRDRD